MSQSTVTLKDIATAAGCSTRVVSAVLNPGSSTVRVGEATQQRILETARERGYRPNQLARAVATGQSRVVGLITDNTDVEHKGYMLDGALQAASARNYMTKVLPTTEDTISRELIDKCLEWRLAGLLAINLSVSFNDLLREETSKLHVPLALLDNVGLHENCISVISDDEQGVRLAIDHLIELGHRHIGFLGGSANTPASMERELYFRASLSEKGLDIRENWIVQSDWYYHHIVEPATRSLIENPNDRPTAILCAGDPLAMMMCRVARLCGLDVPRDLSVVGFANFYLARFSDPPLTTVAQPFREMGRLATERLIDLVESGFDLQSVPLHERLPTRLLQRGSTAPPASQVTSASVLAPDYALASNAVSTSPPTPSLVLEAPSN